MITNRLGVCCIILGDKKSNFKTLQLNRTKQDPNKKQKIFDVYKNNLSELIKVLDYLKLNKIFHYRISSDMFPLADHPDFKDYWDEFCSIESFWTLAKKSVLDFLNFNGRLSTHPDQFCLISSKDKKVNDKGIINLEYHAKMFDMLNIPKSYFCPINIHISNGKMEDVAGDVTNENLQLLSDSVKLRLVFETEDKSFWTFQKIFKHFPNIPITLDYHHRLINNENESEEEAHNFCVTTWKDVRPLFHYSEGKNDRLDRAHSDFINSLPVCATGVDIEIEAKQKNLAVLKYMELVK